VSEQIEVSEDDQDVIVQDESIEQEIVEQNGFNPNDLLPD
jgi:hypothetical protein